MELEDRIVTLIDEEGDSFDFLIIDCFLVGEHEYAIMLPMMEGDNDEGWDENSGCDPVHGHEGDSETNGEALEEEAVLFRICRDDGGETSFHLIDNEEEWQRVSSIAIERLHGCGE